MNRLLKFFSNEVWAKRTRFFKSKFEVIVCTGYTLAGDHLSRGADMIFLAARRWHVIHTRRMREHFHFTDQCDRRNLRHHVP